MQTIANCKIYKVNHHKSPVKPYILLHYNVCSNSSKLIFLEVFASVHTKVLLCSPNDFIKTKILHVEKTIK